MIINIQFIILLVVLSAIMILFQLPIKKKKKDYRILHFFYIPKGKKKRAIWIHLVGLLTGLTFWLAHLLSFPLFLLLTWLGYTGSQETISTLTLGVAILYVLTLAINNYRPQIEKSLERKLKIDIRGGKY